MANARGIIESGQLDRLITMISHVTRVINNGIVIGEITLIECQESISPIHVIFVCSNDDAEFSPSPDDLEEF